MKKPTLKIANRRVSVRLSDNPVHRFLAPLVNWRSATVRMFPGRYDSGLVRSLATLIKMMEDVPSRTDAGAAKMFVRHVHHIVRIMPGKSAQGHDKFMTQYEYAMNWSVCVICNNIKKVGSVSGET